MEFLFWMLTAFFIWICPSSNYWCSIAYSRWFRCFPCSFSLFFVSLNTTTKRSWLFSKSLITIINNNKKHKILFGVELLWGDWETHIVNQFWDSNHLWYQMIFNPLMENKYIYCLCVCVWAQISNFAKLWNQELVLVSKILSKDNIFHQLLNSQLVWFCGLPSKHKFCYFCSITAHKW